MFNSSEFTLNHKINQEISKSFKSVNYSQWERQSKQPIQSQTTGNKKTERHSSSSLVRNRPSSTNVPYEAVATKTSEISEKKTFSNPRPGALGKIHFKSRKQQIEEEAKRNLLKTKIKFTKQNIIDLNDRASELTEMNLDIIEYIDKTEQTANDKVDTILRKYERYQDVLKTVNKKHTEELEEKTKDLNFLKNEAKTELPKYEKVSTEMGEKLENAQDLNKLLSIYKNQEYPEKILQINNLRKNLEDLQNFQSNEKDAFLQMMENDRDREKSYQSKITENIADQMTEKVIGEMHDSLKEMALDNESMKADIEFFNNLLKTLYDENAQLQIEVNELKTDKGRNQRAVIFSDIFIEKQICTPDMDIVLDLPKKELF